jgi:hypothetical protein
VVGEVLERGHFFLLAPATGAEVQQVVLNLHQLPASHVQVSTELAAAESAKAFSNQPRSGAGGAIQLIAESEIPSEGRRGSNCQDLIAKIDCELPRAEFFEASDSHAPKNSTMRAASLPHCRTSVALQHCSTALQHRTAALQHRSIAAP